MCARFIPVRKHTRRERERDDTTRRETDSRKVEYKQTFVRTRSLDNTTRRDDDNKRVKGVVTLWINRSRHVPRDGRRIHLASISRSSSLYAGMYIISLDEIRFRDGWMDGWTDDASIINWKLIDFANFTKLNGGTGEKIESKSEFNGGKERRSRNGLPIFGNFRFVNCCSCSSDKLVLSLRNGHARARAQSSQSSPVYHSFHRIW